MAEVSFTFYTFNRDQASTREQNWEVKFLVLGNFLQKNQKTSWMVFSYITLWKIKIGGDGGGGGGRVMSYPNGGGGGG